MTPLAEADTVILVAVPVQIVEEAAAIVLLAGRAFTVTFTVKVPPVQLLVAGVTVYCSTPPAPPAVVVNVCAIVAPQDELQLLAPLTVPDVVAAVQVKVLPLTVELKATLEAEPEHID